MHKISLLLTIFLALAVLGQAATIKVAKSGVRDWDTISSATQAALDGDTVEVAGGNYNESIAIFDKNNLTLTASADAAVTVTAPTGKDALMLQNCAGFTLKGASADKHFFLVSAHGTALKAIWALSPNLLMEDVEFRGTTDSFAVTCGAPAGEPITFNRCRFKIDGGWSTVLIEGKSAATFNDCNWDQCEGTMNALRFVGEEPGFVKLNRCNVVGHNSADGFLLSNWPAFAFEGTNPATIEATDCHFGNYYWIYDDLEGNPDVAEQVNANKTIRLINPRLGPESMGGAIQTCTGVNGIIQGKSPLEKADLRSSTALFYLAAIYNGTITFQDCIMHRAAWNDVCVSLNVTTKGAKVLNVERCLFPADGAIVTDGTSVGTGQSTINIKNSIIEAKPEAEAQIINTSKGSKETINLTHCTVYPGLNSYGIDMMTGSSNDVLNANYCIFDGFGESTINHDLNLNGTKNLVRNADSFNFGGSAPTQPADTIVADPLLDALTTHLLNGSPAIDAATGSTETLDYDGDARPFGAGLDIGADEKAPLLDNEWANFPAVKAAVAPTLDGTINEQEWPAKPLVMNQYNMAKFQGTRDFTPGATNDGDLSGTFWFMWDQNYLYVAACVTDNSVEYLKDQGEPLNATDIVQLCLDHQNLKADSISAGDYIHDFAPGQKSNANAPAYFQHWPDSGRNTFPNTTLGARKTATGYEIEARLKWSDMTPNPITPAVGTQIGYLALLLDLDGGKNKDLWMNGGNGTDIIGAPVHWNTLTLTDMPVSAARIGWNLYE